MWSTLGIYSTLMQPPRIIFDQPHEQIKSTRMRSHELIDQVNEIKKSEAGQQSPDPWAVHLFPPNGIQKGVFKS